MRRADLLDDVVEKLPELVVVGLDDAAHVDPPRMARLLHVRGRHALTNSSTQLQNQQLMSTQPASTHGQPVDASTYHATAVGREGGQADGGRHGQDGHGGHLVVLLLEHALGEQVGGLGALSGHARGRHVEVRRAAAAARRRAAGSITWKGWRR